MKIISVDTEPRGDINVPVLDIMTNEDMAEAILSRFKPRFDLGVRNCTDDVKKYVKSLRNAPQTQFINPCYDVCEDMFYVSFNFEHDEN